ncbi:MAG: hypothetical protein GEU28_14795 [Dehalococcoidia bacterium]|nr:hypothetical protein [Dehalococcoidia bacterium]
MGAQEGRVADDSVFVERVDHVVKKDGSAVHVPFVGIFEMRNGKIAHWRDYFDVQTWDRQAAASSRPEG